MPIHRTIKRLLPALVALASFFLLEEGKSYAEGDVYAFGHRLGANPDFRIVEGDSLFVGGYQYRPQLPQLPRAIPGLEESSSKLAASPEYQQYCAISTTLLAAAEDSSSRAISLLDAQNRILAVYSGSSYVRKAWFVDDRTLHVEYVFQEPARERFSFGFLTRFMAIDPLDPTRRSNELSQRKLKNHAALIKGNVERGGILVFGRGYAFHVPPKQAALWKLAIAEVLQTPYKPLDRLDTIPDRSSDVDLFFEELRQAYHDTCVSP